MWFEKEKNKDMIKTNEELFPIFIKLKQEHIQDVEKARLNRIEEDKIDKQKSIEFLKNINVSEEFKKYLKPYSSDSAILHIPYLKNDIAIVPNGKSGMIFFEKSDNPITRMYPNYFETLEELLKDIIDNKDIEIEENKWVKSMLSMY